MADAFDEVHLRDALKWCDETLLATIRDAEVYFTEADLWSRRPHISLGGARGLLRYDRQGQYFTRCRALQKAWDDLLQDFRRRIQECEIFLRGVQKHPTRHNFLSPIENLWAQDFKFAFLTEGVSVSGGPSYIGVRASKMPYPPRQEECQPAELRQQCIAPERVGDLDDEVILALLEEHAKRVVEQDANLIAPGKISVMPIIRRKMERRAQTGQLCGTLAAEAKYLGDWIAKKVPSHQVPTTAAIENALREVYRGLRAQSNGIMA